MLGSVALGSGVAVKLDSVVVGGVATSGFEALVAGAALTVSAAGLSGRASCEEMIAGSTGAPLTVDCPVGALLAGGVYLLFDDVRGGKSCCCCLRTPLYLLKSARSACYIDPWIAYLSSSSAPLPSLPTLS